ncbi:Hexuronate transporter [Kluyvera cryocrescens]|uniref:Hexuronate transporter n=1 Tax=Kluyvera cryocrescens TaxID=580 RepID=A0A485APV8_KLUCR|nr:Hexuronate transporter [Kluyvera cryocrescens]
MNHQRSSLPFLTALKTVGKNKRFYGIAIPAFMAEPAWAVMSFWVPLYLSKAYGMDLKQIALFAWLPFLAADLGSVASGYLTKLYVRPVRLLPRELHRGFLGQRRVPDDLAGSHGLYQ